MNRVLVAIALVGAACGAEDGGGDDDGALRCDEEPRASVYSPGMVELGADGVLAVALVDAQPAPPDKGDNAWVIEVRDAATDEVVDGAVVTAEPFMPDHGHGTPIAPEVADGDGAGRYVIERINLWMPGLWEVRVGVAGGERADRVVFAFCVEG